MQVITAEDLTRNPQRVLDSVRAGEPAIIEQRGQASVAIVDVVDYQLLQAAVRAQGWPVSDSDLERGLPQDVVERESNLQGRFDLGLRYYLAGAISTGRLSEVLHIPFAEISTRFHRLGIPIRIGVESIDEILGDVDTAARVTSRA